ncbi:Rrf2 family transcriptional regulator [Vibrio parahaemolyticus]|uniref:Rrf2 family transcriptional regulator n=1 Tax=Vibrio parahaemolyticus TaxID=670 RepID=UPI001124232C|nr:Rrf2 family transcriptional regulator [Vibrio parahaemolyticus]MBE3985589.1 Rrf2 family transcriptional regulator [Vibrio parahaemolyticus]MBE4286488.1 Rrf2 family transcriptional regulator [Vibrio parahaemolyticus]MDF4902148.1 Rrf2 family transcriptional regulator [Vibrio parahaemolyticus]TOH19124.1 hypothetical protein CGI90_03865 [Vibrio parahaemolyticus]HCG7330531.1 Rrf2 family transcriptional regulator [Vibrio parahaemolyticus]
MKLTPKAAVTVNCLVTLINIQEETGREWVRAKSIIERVGISSQHLEQIFRLLRESHIIESRRNAGYKVDLNASLLSIFEAIDFEPKRAIHQQENKPWEVVTEMIRSQFCYMSIGELAIASHLSSCLDRVK